MFSARLQTLGKKENISRASAIGTPKQRGNSAQGTDLPSLGSSATTLMVKHILQRPWWSNTRLELRVARAPPRAPLMARGSFRGAAGRTSPLHA